jgi:signal transduction histidine kinase
MTFNFNDFDKADKIKNLNHYFPRGTLIIYLATSIMCIIGLILDITTIKDSTNYVLIENLITSGIIVVSVLLYYLRKINLPVSFAIIIYVILVNILLDFHFKPYGKQEVEYFLRNSFFIIYLITIASITINKKNGIIVAGIYLASFVSMTLISENDFLKDTIIYQSAVFSAYTAAIYYFVSEFEKNIYKQIIDHNTIIKQNELLNETNSLLKEKKQRIEKLADQLELQKVELIEINKELKEAVSTKDKFFSIIAHDLKNPMSNLIGASELLYKYPGDCDESEKDELTKAIHTSSVSAFNLLDNLLVWSRMQTGGMKTNPEKINLYTLVREVCNVFDNMLADKVIHLEQLVDKEQKVYADKDMLSSVVNNLLSNAIKFTRAGGWIEIRSEISEDEKIKVSISDNGVGIPHENISKIFRIDQSYSSTGTNDEKGTGLGLLLCKEFIERNGGEIWVKSQSGKGSDFCFTLRAV